MDENIDKLSEQILYLEKIAKKGMTKEAILRYGNLKMAHLDLAIKAIAIIAEAIQSGQLKEPLSDEQFKELLKEIPKERKEFKFKR